MKKKDIPIKLVWKQEELKKFWAFITERYNIWYRRFVLKEKYPWTKDSVLSTYKFCNVFRQLDRGSSYVFENILFRKANIESIIYNVMFYRLFNLPYTFELLGGFNRVGDMKPYNGLAARLVDAKNKGNKLFNDAYLTAPGNDLNGRIKAVGYLEGIYRVQLPANRSVLEEISMANSMYDAWKLVMTCRFFGPFISYQVVLDLMSLFHWPDKDSFVYVGPGAKSAMDGFLQASKLIKLEAAKIDTGRRYIDRVYDRAMPELTAISGPGLIKAKFGWDGGVNWAGKKYQSIFNIHDIEFCCCEYRKYRNIQAMLKGGRRVKLRSYKPEMRQLPFQF